MHNKHYPITKQVFFLFFLFLFCFLSVPSFSHSGKTDSNGGHTDYSTGQYHYHHGYSAHQHIDKDGDGVLDCPYDFDDKTATNKSTNRNQSKKKTDDSIINIIVPLAFVGFCGLIYLISFVKEKFGDYRIQKERLAKEEAEKNKLVSMLSNNSLRELAGVPCNIHFVNGLPLDNNDAKYGSYTVYYSESGKYYHNKRGCSSAAKEIHSFVAKKNGLKPCTKCNTHNIVIPDWYISYCDLITKCKLYNIPTDETRTNK